MSNEASRIQELLQEALSLLKEIEATDDNENALDAAHLSIESALDDIYSL